MPEPNSRIVEHLMEALSLAMCCESQNPPSPITRAALQHSVQDLMTELQEQYDDCTDAGGS